MDRFNIPIPPDEDFPEVVVAQRMGEGFKKEYAEYAPRWRFDKRRRAVVVDEKFFYAMADTSERLQAENAKLRELLLDYDKMLEIAADEIAYKSRGLRMDSVLNALRIRMYELGIEVD